MLASNIMNKKLRNALWFLEEHPAIAPEQLQGRYLYFSIQDVCKRGYDRIVARAGLDIWPTHKLAPQFKAEFDKEYRKLEKDYKNEPAKDLRIQKHFVKIEVPYKKVYGEPWKYDRTEFWGEMSFAIYHGNPKKMDRNPYTWQAYDASINTSAPTYEQLVVKMANIFRKKYGNFKRDDFLTPAEKRNHKKTRMFFHIKQKGRPYTTLKKNPKYIDVSDGELNHRWAKWFLTTPYGKKSWGDTEELRKILKLK